MWVRFAPNRTNLGLFKISLRSVSVHFGSPSQNGLNLVLKSPRFVPFEANLTQFWMPNVTSLNLTHFVPKICQPWRALFTRRVQFYIRVLKRENEIVCACVEKIAEWSLSVWQLVADIWTCLLPLSWELAGFCRCCSTHECGEIC